jgi:predicted PurR-regulated permease PerM
VRRAVVIFPLRVTQTKRLFNCVKDTLSAVVYGTVVMAALQGALTGVPFWIPGLRRLFLGRLSLAYVHSLGTSTSRDC